MAGSELSSHIPAVKKVLMDLLNLQVSMPSTSRFHLLFQVQSTDWSPSITNIDFFLSSQPQFPLSQLIAVRKHAGWGKPLSISHCSVNPTEMQAVNNTNLQHGQPVQRRRQHPPVHIHHL